MRTIFKSLYNKKAILDTNVISDLKELGSLDLPNKIFDKVYISSNIICEELDDDTNEEIKKYNFLSTSLVTNDGYDKFLKLKTSHIKLSNSDVIVICIAYEKKLLCCTNDKRARNAAQELECEISGTIGILACAYENSLLDYKSFCNLFNLYAKTCERLNNDLLLKIRKEYHIYSSNDTDSMTAYD